MSCSAREGLNQLDSAAEDILKYFSYTLKIVDLTFHATPIMRRQHKYRRKTNNFVLDAQTAQNEYLTLGI